MYSPGRKVLFVGHDASRTGAPIALLTFMRWLGATVPDWRLALLLATSGELFDEFAAIAPTRLLENGPNQQSRDQHLHLPFKPDLLYYNTVAAAGAVPLVSAGFCPALCHVHELELTIRQFRGSQPTGELFSRFSRFVTCSSAVRQNLIDRHAVPEDQIDVVRGFLPDASGASPDRQAASAWLKQRLSIPPEAFIVGAAGSLDWRKGVDLFSHLARTVDRHAPGLPVHFVWLGGTAGSTGSARFEHDVSRMTQDMRRRITLIPSDPNPDRYFSAFDLFVLPSREEPFGLVCLESAKCGTPILCFDQAGGAVEFVQNDCGAVVPYLDLHAMADQIIRLLADPSTRAKMGEIGRQRVQRDHDIAIAGPRIVESIERAIRPSVS